MKKINFNKNWICYRTGQCKDAFPVILPHDAMLLDGKSETSAGGVNIGWYDAADYTYEKSFEISRNEKGKIIFLEFEGVYRKATVYINGDKVAYHEYGYTGFYIDVTEYLRYGAENQIKVEVVNSDQPNSRWYSGTGIYRPVWMYIFPEQYILPESIHVTTINYRTREICVELVTSGKGVVQCDVLYEDKILASEKKDTNGKVSWKIKLPKAELWEPECPVLYTCRATYGDDIQSVRFGIRQVEWSAEKGFCINGVRTILKGACVHHDNGLLGACAYEFAEYRKIRILKKNGFNAIRSAHNPCSKALLEACDELGMLVMDEYADAWYIHKTKYDYAGKVEINYKEDLKSMVSKDYNHPSVIMYSIGNEVSETAQKRGIELSETMISWLHRLDESRPVTCGVNIFFNFLSSMGFGVYSDKKANKDVKATKKKKAVGSEFFNNLAGLLGSDFMKFGATLYPCDVKTRDAFAAMDIAGYNYGINRYSHDLNKYPKRLIIGSETFCSDAYRFWETAKKNIRLIGDFVWSGIDYLGEVGIGSWEYSDYARRFDGGMGWVSAGAGRIDLTGKPLAEMKYMRVAFELDSIGIGVIPVNHTTDRHSPSAWKMTNAVESWSWNGYEGEKALVEVYTRAATVSLFINGKCVGTKHPKKDCRVLFQTVYEPGELKAVAYDISGKIIAETKLLSAGNETMLEADPEQAQVDKKSGLCYVRLKFTDKKGIVKPLTREKIKIAVDGGVLLACGSACPYYTGSYLSEETDTYFGEAMAIIRPNGEASVHIHAESKYGNADAEIEVI